MTSTPITFLRLENFRNLAPLEFRPHPCFNFFYGENAQGKTSVLEAIFFCSELKSFRCPDVSFMVTHGAPAAKVKSEIQSEGLSFGLEIQWEGTNKQVLLNGKTPRPLRRLRRLIPIVLFTPESVRLFRQGPAARRDYFDGLFGLLSEDFSQRAAGYLKLLRQKQGLLERAREEGTGKRFWEEWEIWSQRLAEEGAWLTEARFAWNRRLAGVFKGFFDRLSHQDWEAALHYVPRVSEIAEDHSSSFIQGQLWEIMKRRSAEEVRRNQVLVGPHRDDWELRLNGVNFREEGSQGQHRIAAAALKLAESALILQEGMTPVALFDDLLSELDSRRVSMVLEELGRSNCQVFLTSVHPGERHLIPLKGQAFRVEGGRVYNPVD